MTSIAQYQAHRAAVTHVDIKGIPEVRPFAVRHVAALQAQGKSGAVLRQLVREAQSIRRTTSEAGLIENAPGLDVDAVQRGFDAFCNGLETARNGKPLAHLGGKFNPINNLSIEDQARATWAGFCSVVGRIAERNSSVQRLATAVAGNLRKATGGAAEYKPLTYERAALVLIDHFCLYTGWMLEITGDRVMLSARQQTNSVQLTQKFLDDVLTGQGILADISERKPMLVPPVPWSPTATHGGYLHNAIPALRGTRGAIESSEIVSALNAMQATAFRVNTRVLAVARVFRISATDLPTSLVAGEFIEERHDLEYAHQHTRAIRSALTIGAYEELADEEEFYFPWNLDWRGRMYPATSLISPHGDDLTKGCLEFADGTPLGREGGDWLAILLCNLAGGDKEIIEDDGTLTYRTRTPAERIQWTREHSAQIIAVAESPLARREWHFLGGFGREKIKRGKRAPACIDNPWQFLAACFEWADYQAEGPGMRSRLAGALDGSCSGVQMLSGMTRDASAGAMVNLVPAPRGDDYYGQMARALTARLCGMVRTASPDDMQYLRFWSEQTLDRDLLKAPSMTKVYSAGTFTFGTQVQAKTGAGERECMWLAAQINECFRDVAPGMLRAMAYLQEVTDVLTAAGIALNWRTPTGMPVYQGRVCTTSTRIETNTNGVRRARVFQTDTDKLSRNRQRAGVAPNFVHGVDASHMVMTVNALHAQGVRNFWMVHDSFGAPLTQCQQVFDTTREQFVRLMSRDLLREWAEEVTAYLPDADRRRLPEPPEYGNLDLAAVRESIYAWF